MLHIHVLLVAPLGADYMAEPGTDQHQSRIAIREAAHYSGAAADLPVEPFNDIVGADTSPVFAGKVAVSKRLFNAVFCLLCSLAQLHGTKLLRHRFSLLSSNVIKLAAKKETAEGNRIPKEIQKELIRKKRQQKQTEAAPSEKGYSKGQRAEA